MKKPFFAAFALALGVTLAGCVFINLPHVEPPAEKVIGGQGPDKVAVIDISGVIDDEGEKNLLGSETGVNITARVREELGLAMEDKAVAALILRINTPGGAVTTCDIINHEITEWKKRKKAPVVAELMDIAASGGYYVAAAADRIIAHPTTVTGSIGVVAFNVNASGLMDKIGITDQTIKSGVNKDIGSPMRPMSDAERKILQSVIDDMYERFLDRIIEGRPGAGFKKEALRAIADGRIYTAPQALDLKLIDAIGYMDDAVSEAKQAAHIKDATVITYSAPSSYKNNLYSSLAQPMPSTVNLVNIDGGALRHRFGMSFMYMWRP
ncbi:MAG: signal peptide peptidase SppA [Deltaproteobacteria bacterium]|nr:signal peptide peptidase SppA [Deltaproteobacteria bacterium]